MKRLACLVLLVSAPPAWADYVVAAHTIRANTVLTATDIAIKPGTIPGGAAPEDLIGKEARVSLYAGRPIRRADVGAPAIVARNQIVTLVYLQGALRILTEGRSLSRAGAGERVRVMNLSSRTTVFGRVSETGDIIVSE
ncbi:flagellar basal body P-ring formation chaperone FlgA [Roseovarius sp. SYSU LYC5161]|uniref:flagellar basal body P-ring formation chaperone FlgA n=1 Tax=Roseovarius halophilus (ex Wu et al. 2025) TaxID=3376060 RepID=UPI0028714561|nr:flagellar basal body P-ring formation chaperone FlgA [Roseovarius sp.]